MGAFFRSGAAVLLLWASLSAPDVASGFGAEGHRIAGRVAQERLCDRAAAEIDTLAAGERLEHLGVWADRIRSEDRWAHTAPWHYMNVADAVPLERYRTPEEGDVLWAIAHFGVRLADDSLASGARLEALRFLTHFVVDLHQPLHVGRASDRGGNQIRVVTTDGLEVNLHRFWDTEAIRLAGLPEDAYVAQVLDLVAAQSDSWGGLAPLEWARESRDLRSRVYDFRGNRLSRAYLDGAVRITQRRLAQAGTRLAAEINRLLCDG